MAPRRILASLVGFCGSEKALVTRYNVRIIGNKYMF